MPQPEPYVQAAIKSADWKDLGPRLVAFARDRLYQPGWWGNPPGQIGWEPEDLANEAVRRVLDGTRSIKPELTLYQNLCGVISSIVMNEGKYPRDPVRDHTVKISQERDNESPDPILRRKILKLLHGDVLLIQIVNYKSAHPSAKPREIAEGLGLPIKEIRKAQKRLKGRLEPLRSTEE